MDAATKAAEQAHEEFSAKLESLESDLRQSREDGAAKDEVTLQKDYLIHQLEQQLDGLSGELECSKGDRARLVAELDVATKAAEQAIEEFSSKVESLESDLLQARDDIVAKDSISLQKDHRILHLEQQSNGLSRELEQSKGEIARLKTELNDANKLAKQAHDEFNAKLASLESHLLQSKEDNAAKLAMLLSTENNLKQSLADVEAKRDQLLSENDLLKKEKDLLAEKGERKKQDSWHIVSWEDVLAEKKSAQNEVLSITSERDELLAAKNTLQQKVDSLNEQVAEIRQNLGIITEERDNLSASRDSMQKQVTSLASKVNELTADKETQIDDLQRELDRACLSLTESKTLQAVLTAENHDMQRQIEAMQSKGAEMESLQQELRSNKKLLDEAKGNLSAEQAERDKMNENLLSKLYHVSKQKDSIEQDMAKHRVMIDSLQKEMLSLKSEREGLSAEKDSLQKKVESLVDNVEEIASAKSKEVQELRNILDTTTTERDGLLADNSTMRQKIDSLLGEVASVTSATMSAQLSASHTDTGKMSKRLDELSTELSDAKKDAIRVQEELKSKITTLEIDLLESKESNGFKESEIARLQDELDKLCSGGTPQDGSLSVISAPQSNAASLSDSFSFSPTVAANHTAGGSVASEVTPRRLLGPAPPLEIVVQGFSHRGLSVVFNCTKPDPLDNQKSIAVAHFVNFTDDPLVGLNMKVAVPKYVSMKMKHPTSTTVPVRRGSNSKEVTQTISLTNTMLGTKSLVLKIKVSFTSKGTKVEHMATCSGFPMGQI
ncbi:hypothetical protein ACHAWF_013715 [Thalassiosira exigua]